MISENTNWYIESLMHELEKLEVNKFTGNIEFQFNFKEGSCANCNINLKKSIKKNG